MLQGVAVVEPPVDAALRLRMKNTARLSRCRTYRFALWRTWNADLKSVMFVGLNPSTADESRDDPTLVRCINYAKSWGYGGVCMANLFAFRATLPADLKTAKAPVGRQNDRWLVRLASESGLLIAAWGNDGLYLDRASQVRRLLPKMHCLAINKTGEPAHPLYQKAGLQPLPMPE